MNQTRVNAGLIASALGLLLGLSACATDRVAPPEEQAQPVEELPPEVRVGLLPLSGPAEALGRDMLDAAQMALFDVGDNDLVLLPRDTGTPRRRAHGGHGSDRARRRGDPRAAVRGSGGRGEPARGAGRRPGTGVLERRLGGDLMALSCSAFVRRSRCAGWSTTRWRAADCCAPSPRRSPGRMRPQRLQRMRRPRWQPTFAQPTSDQGAFDPGSPRIAGLAPDDAYGATALEALRRAVEEGGGVLGETLLYPTNFADPSPVVRRIAAYDGRAATLEAERARLEQSDDPQAAQRLQALETVDTIGGPPFDAILLADGGDSLRSVAALLTFFDVDPATTRFLGTMRWQADPRVLAEGRCRAAGSRRRRPTISPHSRTAFAIPSGGRPRARRSPTTPPRSRSWSRATWATAASPRPA